MIPIAAWTIDQAMFDGSIFDKGAYTRLVGRKRDFVKMSRQHGDDMHKKMDQEER